MNVDCLIRAFREAGRPIVFLTLLCLGLGLLFTLIGSEVGIALIVAGLGALGLFILLGSSMGCRHNTG
ncbi:hypothetical protein [Sedimenticola sp.]|uniref:hypothetical protein n=1 Tax=Sedimenticola sp. TaxID=1940285 RepID=UPI003D10E1FB